jgi:putative peptidoglycan lipid II flippase
MSVTEDLVTGEPVITSDEVNRRIGRSSVGLMAANGSAYAARFLKVIIIAQFFGTGVAIESYNAALNLPLVINGVLQGALLTALVPMLVELRARGGQATAAQLWTRFGLGTLAVIAALCLAMALGAEPLARRIIDPTRHDLALTTHLLRLLLGYLALYFVAQYFTLIFHSHHRFVFPMLTTLPNLVVNLVVILAWFRWIGVEIDPLVWGLYAGAVVQIALLVFVGWRDGILRPAWGPTPTMGRAARNSVILLLAGLVSPATLITVDIIMARTVERGIATLWYAYSIFMVPVTVGIMNLGYVLLPYLSGQIVRRDWEGLSHTVSVTTRLLLFVTVPTAAGLWLVSDDLVRVVMERGEFLHRDTLLVGAALRAYVWGLLFAGLTVVVTKIFNAMQRVRAIFVVSALAFAIKIAANAILRVPMGAAGIALATAIFYGVSFVLLTIWLWRTVPLHLDRDLGGFAGVTLLGGAVLVIGVGGTRAALLAVHVPIFAVLIAEVAVGAAVWILYSAALGLPELRSVWGLLSRWGSQPPRRQERQD